MLPTGRIALVAAVALFTTACATMNVSSHVERGVDFTQYRTFSWGPADSLPTGDPRLDNNPFFHDYFQGAVEKGMAAKGLQKVENGTPDLVMHYHANVSQRFSVDRAELSYTPCVSGNCEPRVNEYEAGTLVLDVLDARTNKLVWRGWAQQSVDGVIDNQDWLNEYVTNGVEKMLARYPTPAK